MPFPHVWPRIRRQASIPLIFGKPTSSRMTSGRSRSASTAANIVNDEGLVIAHLQEGGD